VECYERRGERGKPTGVVGKKLLPCANADSALQKYNKLSEEDKKRFEAERSAMEA
jgi:hypothetical protein